MTKRTCCDGRDTPYCPECGGEVFAGSSLLLLLKHVESHAVDYENRLALHQGVIDRWPTGKDEELRKKRKATIHKINRTASKWRTWATELEALLDKEKEG